MLYCVFFEHLKLLMYHFSWPRKKNSHALEMMNVVLTRWLWFLTPAQCWSSKLTFNGGTVINDTLVNNIGNINDFISERITSPLSRETGPQGSFGTMYQWPAEKLSAKSVEQDNARGQLCSLIPKLICTVLHMPFWKCSEKLCEMFKIIYTNELTACWLLSC